MHGAEAQSIDRQVAKVNRSSKRCAFAWRPARHLLVRMLESLASVLFVGMRIVGSNGLSRVPNRPSSWDKPRDAPRVQFSKSMDRGDESPPTPTSIVRSAGSHTNVCSVPDPDR